MLLHGTEHLPLFSGFSIVLGWTSVMGSCHLPAQQVDADTMVGPVLKVDGGYAFDTWTAADGPVRGYAYRRIEDAIYARNSALRAASSDGARSHS